MTILISFLFFRVFSSDLTCDAPVGNQRTYWEQDVGLDAALWGLDVLPSLGGTPLPTNVFLGSLPGLATGGFNSDNIAFEAAECYSRAIDSLNQRASDLEENMNKHICDQRESRFEVQLTYSELVREIKNIKDNIISDNPLACGLNTKTKQLEGVCTGVQFRQTFLDKVEARFDNVAEIIKRLTLAMSGPENVNCLKCTSRIYEFDFLHSWAEECDESSRVNGGNPDCVVHEDRRTYSVEECLGDSKWQQQFMSGYYIPVVNAVTMATNLWAEVAFVGKSRNDLDFQGLVDASDIGSHYDGIFKAFDEFRVVTNEHLYWQSGGSNLPPGFTLPAECNERELVPGDALSWKRSPVQDTCPVRHEFFGTTSSRDCGMATATCVTPLSFARDRIDASLKQHQEWLSGTFSPVHKECSSEGVDRHAGPALPCCEGLIEVVEPRSSDDAFFCLPTDPGFQTSCFDNIVICRDASTIVRDNALYLGCYKNEFGADRLDGHDADVSFGYCSAKAAGGLFGLEFPQGFHTPGHAECLQLSSLPNQERVPDAECEVERDDFDRRLGSSHRLAVYSGPRDPVYMGCYKNEFGDKRLDGHFNDISIDHCDVKAAGGLFGMEFPQGFDIPGHAECLLLPSTKVQSRVPDAECEEERDARGRRLGNSHRVAVYRAQTV